MVLLRSSVTAALAAISLLGSTLAVPLVDKLRRLGPEARDILKKSTPTASRFFVYDDARVSSLPSSSQLEGYSVYCLAFWISLTGPADMAQTWEDLSASQRTSILQEYNATGISLMVSAFGSTDTPTTSGANASAVANNLATWVIEYGVQGVDVDYEDFDAFSYGQGSAERWLIDFTTQLRSKLPQGEYILTHAPVAPWFSPSSWNGGGYLAVDKSVGSMIDWYNIQFYNQGATEYTTCSGLLTNSSSKNPESALFQISANGVLLDKLVIGKPATPASATNGYMDPETLNSCVSKAYAQGWSAGVMVWQYPDATSAWIQGVRGDVF